MTDKEEVSNGNIIIDANASDIDKKLEDEESALEESANEFLKKAAHETEDTSNGNIIIDK